MKRLLSWLTGVLLMAGLMAGLILPASVHADNDLVGKYSGNEIRNIADDKIAAREGKSGPKQLLGPSLPAPACTPRWPARSCWWPIQRR